MMPRKRRRMLIIVLILALLVILAAVVGLLYSNTDMFKSNATLFAKYMGQNIENMDEIYHRIGNNSEYNQSLQESKYTIATQVKVNYMEDIGTSLENTENSINQLKLEIKGQVDKQNQYNYQDINLLKDEEKVAEVEYIQNENVYGIRFSDLFGQYVLVNHEDLKELLEKLNYNYIPDTEEFDFELLEEEKQNLQTKYMNIINQNVSKDKFSKQKDQVIQIDGKNTNVNAYTLTLTKEEMNRLYIKILEEMKQDEMILTRIDKLESLLQEYQTNEISNIREEFAEKIDNLISDITKNNIGQEEAKITVYENYHTTKRIKIENPDYQITIDMLASEETDYVEVSFIKNEEKQERVFTYKKEKEETSTTIKNIKDEKTTEYSLIATEKIQGDDCTKTILAKYESDTDRVEAMIEQEINKRDNFEEETQLTQENTINLSELEEEQAQSIIKQVNDKVSEKINDLTTTDINTEDMGKVLKTIGFAKEDQTFESEGITQTEKKRFNSKFEILQGENLESNDVLNLLNAIKDNLVDIEVVSNTELKLKLNQYQSNEDLITTLTNFVEQNKNKKYNAKVEYDEETGLVSDVLLIMLER